MSDEMVNMLRYDTNKKSKGIALLFWFFLGWLGAHRFYLEKYESAIPLALLWIVGAFLFLNGFGLLLFGWLVWMFIDLVLIFDIVNKHNNKLISNLVRGEI